jgi:hypothetical protein
LIPESNKRILDVYTKSTPKAKNNSIKNYLIKYKTRLGALSTLNLREKYRRENKHNPTPKRENNDISLVLPKLNNNKAKIPNLVKSHQMIDFSTISNSKSGNPEQDSKLSNYYIRRRK